MALAFDAVGPSSAGVAGSASTLSWSHTLTGAGGLLLAAVACDVDATTISSVTWGAASMAPLFAGAANYKHSNGASAGWLAVFKLVNAAAGTATITATLSGASVAEGGSLSFSGTDTTSGIGTPQSAVGASATPSLAFTPNTSGNLLAAFIVNGAFINSTTSPGTSRFVNNTGGSNAGGFIAGQTAPATGSSVTLAWGVNADFFAIVAAEVLVGGGATVTATGASGTGTALNAVAQSSNTTVGPKYAGTATDLGGGYGAWNTPNYATGGP